MVLSVFDGGFSAKVGSSLYGQVQAGTGLIKATGREGCRQFESADKLHSIQLKYTATFRLCFHIKAQTVWAPVPSHFAAICNMYVFELPRLLKGKMSSMEASTSLLSGAHFTQRQLAQVLFLLWNCTVYFDGRAVSDNSLTEVSSDFVKVFILSSSTLLWLLTRMNNFLLQHNRNTVHYIITGLNWITRRSKELLSVLCLGSAARLQSFSCKRKKSTGKKEAPKEKGKKKGNLGDLILQTARQTLVTCAKEGQLLCIPDEVETSASGENKHELYVSPVYCWQIKTTSHWRCQNIWAQQMVVLWE